MAKPVLILVTGLPGTGKTTLSQKLAPELGVALLAKDGIKEILFDELGWSDREWSMKLGRATYHVMDYVIEGQLKAGHSLMVESPLVPAYEEKKYQQWQEQYGFFCIQVLCHARGDVLVKRVVDRSHGSERHPGHGDAIGAAEITPDLTKGKEDPMALDGTIIEVDTTDFSKVDTAAIIRQIRGAINAPYLL